MASPARFRLVLLVALAAGCDADGGRLPAEPGDAGVQASVSATAANSGLSVRVSPRYATLYVARGRSSTIPYTARLVDSAGAVQPLSSPNLRWRRSNGFVRLGRPWMDSDGVTARANADVVRAGRDTVFVQWTPGAAETGFGAVVAYEWAEVVTRRPATYTRQGESRCAELGAESADGETLVLKKFQRVYARSLDPETVIVDSTAFTADGEAVRICVTGRTGGTGRIAMVGWDTLALRYVGSYEPHHVLVEPLALSVEHERWEIGRGQRERIRARIVDARGLEVVLPEGEVESWETSDASVVEVDGSTGVLTGVASGSARISTTLLGKTAHAEADVYEIVGGGSGWGVTCVLTRRGTVRCWGNGNHPKIGYGLGRLGTLAGPDVGDVPLGGRATSMTMEGHFACVLLEAGEVRCWGSDFRAQLGYGVSGHIGDDETPEDAGPVPVGGRVAAIGGGDARACAIMDDRGLRCWGYNVAGQLGYGSAVTDVLVGDDETVADIGNVPVGGPVVQMVGGRLWTCALLDDGRVRCWGINSEVWDRETRETGQNFGLGYGRRHGFTSPVGDDETPADVGDLPLPGRAVKLAGSGYHACALMDDGAVRCWGFNGYGALGHGRGGENIGDDETAASTVPLWFPGSVVDIVAGYFHTCALLEEGDVYCWGFGDYGYLGYGNRERIGDDETAASAGPVPLGGPAERLLEGTYSTCAVLRSGLLRCWGSRSDLVFLPENVGDDETPSDVPPVRVFPGPVPAYRIGDVEAQYSDFAATTHRAPAARSFLAHADADTPQRPWEDLTGDALPGTVPLTGAEGLLTPDSVAGGWIRVTGRDR